MSTEETAPQARRAPRVAIAGEHVLDLLPEDGGALRPVPGGGPANIAVATARLGTPTMLLSRFGADVFAERLRGRMTAESVDLSRCPSGLGSSALALATLAADGSARYDFWLEDAPDWGWTRDELAAALPDSVRVLHLGSIAALRPPGDAELLALAERERGRRIVTFDPNVRMATLPGADHARARVEDFCRVSHLVKASDDDLAELYPGTEPEKAAQRLLALGPRAVVVTRGGEGAFALSAAGRADVTSPLVQVHDTIGAGDTFMAALVSGCAAGEGGVPEAAEEMRALLATAANAAAVNCTRPGADPPTAAELAEFG
ncbi:PfkB family carbohydrate kinase [Streptomonospora litoralis]|uniref:2-dehydro-3-deoxygluconokinase n=1 Tax=Streptomonospora litoralis TaxID=2498135 RepID=A0A4P6Q7W9_9ACTN|nr:PfkB family carbohydrate kinase [Streptomonospora litoralis]QBI55551.1 2-dehydro-3-deoxygluconokinase [Streptomonospora litoralis]